MEGGVKLPSGINPGGKIGGLKLGFEGCPEHSGGGGGSGEEGVEGHDEGEEQVVLM